MASNVETEAFIEKETFFNRARLFLLFKNSILVIVLLIAWEVAPRTGMVQSAFFPPLSEVLQAIWDMLLSGALWDHVSISLKRAITGLILGIVVGIPLGLLIGWSPIVRKLLNPIFELMRNTAKLAILPVFILFLGIGEVSKVTLIFYACIIPILLNSITAIGTIDPLLIKSAKSMSISPLKLFAKVIIPAALPAIFVGIRIAGTSCILALVAAEMLGASEGLGFLIIYSENSFKIPEMYAGILIISVLGLCINYALVLSERYLLRWKQPVR
ncbi:ABC transporter permease [Paenibacillus xylaniclasticus]|uniref:ABC transporter permease n=1 Tax=Paenibacillus xylaniclasticus TaxID=588083 RepID=UPI000FD81823|nr:MULTISPECIES: ABC transporter permease [Paenibacillus]GFN32937.1 ABC transporter permease [Paenibacillus curdlanolyticus]